MKILNVMAFALLVLSSNSFARTIVKTDFNGDRSTRFEQSIVIVEAVLSDDGILKVVENTYSDDNLQNLVDQRTAQKKLNSGMFDRLVQKASMLADVDLKTTHTPYVCKMLPLPGASRMLDVATSFNVNSNKFDGKMRNVLSREGCWLHVHTAPADIHSAEQARALRDVLEFLALEVLSSN